MKMSNELYDTLKKISLMLVPIATLVTALSEIWGYPHGAQIAATISAIGICLGACLVISSKEYHKEDEEDKAGE